MAIIGEFMLVVLAEKKNDYTGEEKSFQKWGGWTASAGSRIYKSGWHKIMDFLSITKTSRWEVVKHSASPNRPFFFFFFWTLCHFSHFASIFSPNHNHTYLFIHFLALHIYFSSALLSSSVCFSTRLSIV